MARLHTPAVTAVLCCLVFWASGCSTSSAPPARVTPPASNSTSTASSSESSEPAQNGQTGATEPAKTTTSSVAGSSAAAPKDYPDIPKIELMTEINGIKIPRMPKKEEKLQLTGKLPADVGNTHAAAKPSTPTTGDTLIARFPSEPKVLNHIIATDAVISYILQYVADPLSFQNPETFEYEPHIATKWIVEDSVKLSPDYPGQVRRVALEGGQPAPTVEIDYPKPAVDANGKPGKPAEIILTTSNADGQPLGKVWVGVFPIGKIVGAPTNGYHLWSEADGKVSISAIRPGKYTVKVGAEVYGKTQHEADGSLIVTPASVENPLNEMLKSSGNATLSLKPGEWADVQQQTCYTYYLRDDVKWSDGAPFTTKDIEFAHALLNNPSVDGDSMRTYYQDLIECRALSPHIVRMQYRQQYFKAFEFTYSLTLLAPPFHLFSSFFKPDGRELTLERLTPDEEKAQKKISAHGQEFGKFFNTDSRYNRAPLGTGPYIVDTWVNKDRVELVRNKNYWKPERAGHVDRIIIKFIPDQTTAMAAMKAGEIDFFYDMSPEQYFEDWNNIDPKQRENYVKAEWYSPMFSYFGWNQLAPQFQDRRVRVALALLFDRQNFVDTKLHGAGIVVSGTQYYFGPGYDHDVPPLGYDPETARELLADAGWIDTDNDGILDRDGKKFEIVLRVAVGRPINLQRCEVLQKNLKSAGIDLQIQQLEWASFIDKVRAKENDVITLSWATPIESDPFQIWHSSGAGRENRGSNTISFANPQADSLIELLRVTLDEDKRKRIHSALHRLLDSEQPYMFLWIPKEFGAYHKRFRNVKWYRLRPGFDLSEWYVPKDEQLH